jgi:mannose-6-phosphate isomerase-like protein (cupin superfamily)
LVRKSSEMDTIQHESMRGGTGTVSMKEIVEKNELNHSRLFSLVTVPIGGSIGRHEHINETEYYYILSGNGAVGEGSGEIEVLPGDMVVTGNGDSHSIRNSGSKSLEFLAVIMLDD